MLTLSRNIKPKNHRRKSCPELNMMHSNINIKAYLDVEYFLTDHADEVKIRAINSKCAKSSRASSSNIFRSFSMKSLGFYREALRFT
jgi:hypothetical protein